MDSLGLTAYLDIPTILIAAVTFVVTYICMYSRDKGYKLPPGPPVLPLIGTVYSHSSSIDGYLIGRRIFGRAATLYIGHIRAVLLNTYDTIKEAAITKAANFSDRGLHVSFCSNATNPHLKGIISSDFHDKFRQNRSDSLAIMRHLGVGRSTMEEKILEEAKEMKAVFAAKKGEAFDPWHAITCSVANVILHVTVNKRHEHGDPELLHIIECTDNVVKAAYHVQFIDGFNFLRFVPPFSRTYAKLLASDKGMKEYMWKNIKKLMDNFQHGNDSNFVDCWLSKHFNESDANTEIDKENLLHTLRDFLIAGSETTTTSLKWTILFLANRPVIQEKVHDEIMRMVGKDRLVRLSDRVNLPYLEAIIWEIQRINTIVPGSLPHYARLGSRISKYDIPADTIVGFNLHAVHMSRKTFGDPEVFRPERFIDEGGKFIKHPNVIPFSIGKRSCLGELLARQELFLFTAVLFQNFKFMPPEGEARLEEKGIVGFTYGPKPFQIRALLR